MIYLLPQFRLKQNEIYLPHHICMYIIAHMLQLGSDVTCIVKFVYCTDNAQWTGCCLSVLNLLVLGNLI